MTGEDLPDRSPKRMLVLSNPHATTMSDRLRNLAIHALRGRFLVEAIDTERPGHATELSRDAAADGFDVVVAFGGDGTINEVANGLAQTATALTPLPGGATNVYCRMLGVPLDVIDAIERLLSLADAWSPRTVDLGRVGERWFLFAAGAGLDASVVRHVDAHPHAKAQLGPWYYAGAATRTFLSNYLRDPPQLVAAIAGVDLPAISVFVQNAHLYTYFGARPISLARACAIDSGDLSGAVLDRVGMLDLAGLAYGALAERADLGDRRRVSIFDGVEEVLVRSADARGFPIQVDGDYVDTVAQARFTVGAGALQLMA